MGYFLIDHSNKEFGPVLCAACAEAIARKAMFLFMNETKPAGENWNPQVEMLVSEKTATVHLAGYPSKTYHWDDLDFTGCD